MGFSPKIIDFWYIMTILYLPVLLICYQPKKSSSITWNIFLTTHVLSSRSEDDFCFAREISHGDWAIHKIQGVEENIYCTLTGCSNYQSKINQHEKLEYFKGTLPGLLLDLTVLQQASICLTGLYWAILGIRSGFLLRIRSGSLLGINRLYWIILGFTGPY